MTGASRTCSGRGHGPDAETVGSLRLEPDLQVLATRALARACGEDSEWRELWEEAGQYDEARSALEPLMSALNGTTGDQPAVE